MQENELSSNGGNPSSLRFYYRTSFAMNTDYSFVWLDHSTPPEFFFEKVDTIFKPIEESYVVELSDFLDLPSYLQAWYICTLDYRSGK